MSEVQTSRISLGISAGVIAGLLAAILGIVCWAPNTALAASENSGGLIFTYDNNSGQTVTTVSQPSAQGVVTVSGGDADITVTQEIVGSGADIASSVAIVGNYSGTLTFSNVTLMPQASQNALSISGGTTGCTVILQNGTVFHGSDTTAPTNTGVISITGGGSNTIQIADAAVTTTNYEKTDGTGVTVAAQPAINVDAYVSNPTTQTIQFTSSAASIIGGDLANAQGAINYESEQVGATALVLQVDADVTVTGISANVADAYGPAAALTVIPGTGAQLASGSKAKSFVTIQGNGDLSLVAGGYTDTTGPANSGVGTPAFYISSANNVNGSNALIAGPGSVIAQGGAGIGNNTSGSAIGGSGIEINTANGYNAVLTIENGEVEATGGNGGYANSAANSAGGAGIAMSSASGVGNSALLVTGGVVNATGGNANENSNTAAGGAGISGGLTTPNTHAWLYVGNGSGTDMTGPTVTALVGKYYDGSLTNSAISNIGSNGANIQIYNGVRGKRTSTTYPWVALTANGIPSSTSDPVIYADVVGFGGMDGSLTGNIPNPLNYTAVDGSTNPSQYLDSNGFGDAGPADGTVVSLEKSPWAQITPSPITGLNSGLAHAQAGGPYSVGQYAPYVVAQTAATMTGTKPDPAYTYEGTVAAVFDGLENVNPVSNFWTLLTGNLLSNNEVTLDSANNVTMIDDTDFYINTTATGNTLTVTLDPEAIDLDNLDAFTALYPELSVPETAEVPIVYTVTLNAQADPTDNNGGFPSGSAPSAVGHATKSWNYFTAPDGSGDLVVGNGANPPGIGSCTPGAPTWAMGAQTTSVKTLDQDIDSTSRYDFLGFYDETSTDPASWSQVNINAVGGYNHNVTLTGEWGILSPVSVTPSPTDMQQGTEIQLTADYAVTLVSNPKVTEYGLLASGINPDWIGIFTNLGFGNSASNGVTVKATGGEPATLETNASGQLVGTTTTVGTVTANPTATPGHYRVWPQLNQLYNSSISTQTPSQYAVYGIVNVIPAEGTITVVRMYNPFTLEHLYTTDANEVETLDTIGWDNEGVAWIAPVSSDKPIYRLFNPYNSDHMYTTSYYEYTTLQGVGWRGEGEKLWSAPETSPQVYRLYNPYMTENGGAFSHLWTGDFNEYVTLGGLGWKQESVAWNAISVPMPE